MLLCFALCFLTERDKDSEGAQKEGTQQAGKAGLVNGNKGKGERETCNNRGAETAKTVRVCQGACKGYQGAVANDSLMEVAKKPPYRKHKSMYHAA